MFEILFANWGPPCRVLVDNISEWFSIFFLIYRRGRVCDCLVQILIDVDCVAFSDSFPFYFWVR